MMTSFNKKNGTHPTKKSSQDGADRTSPSMPMHRAIYEELLAEIQTGVYKPGERLPSEALLCERFGASRITVAKAFQTLQRDHLVTRRPGSGTYVEAPSRPNSLQFGLLIPDLGTTEIFEPICQGIMRSPASESHSLTWGYSTNQESDPIKAMENLCQQYIAQRVAGVFFAPSEFTGAMYQANHKIAATLEHAGIPIVLLDRCYERYPDRSRFDLVGIDNHRVGYRLTRHLLQVGAKKIVFAMRPNSAPTVDARIGGYREALYALQSDAPSTVISGDFEDPVYVQKMLDLEKPDGIVCANDATAARLMQTLVSLGVKIPGDVRMVGVDDVRYAKFLPTPLTTIRQNCAEIGQVAMATMLARLDSPERPAKDTLVRCALVIRASSGVSAEAITKAANEDEIVEL